MISENELLNDFNSFINVGEKGSDCLVFQLGSHSIKFGFASQLTPFVIPNCIAYKRKKENETIINKMQVDEEIDDKKELPEINETFYSNLLIIEQETIKKQIKLEQQLKGKKNIVTSAKSFPVKNIEHSETEIPERKNFEQPVGSTAIFKKSLSMSYELNDDISENNYKWTSIQNDPNFVIGREALSIAENDKYLLRYPIKYGFFNNEYAYQGVLDDLQKIIEYCIFQILQIKKKDIINYSIVLILPDLFVKQQVKGLVNLFLKVLNFKSIFLHLESVMSSFGAALQNSCVVDIGSTKVNVCCVDEGMIIEESLIRKNFGGDDLSKLFYMMLSRKTSARGNFPIECFDMNNPYHCRVIEKMKETECELPSIQNPCSQFPPKTSKVWLHRKNKNTKIFTTTIAESVYVTPLSYFYPEIFESFRNVVIPYLDFYNDIYSEIYTDPEDMMTELFKTLLTPADNNKKEEPNLIGLNSSVKKSKMGNDDNDDSLSVSHSKSDENSSQFYDEKTNTTGKKNTYENMFKLIPIDDIICQSIMSVNSSESRKKLANSILLVGGGVKFKGMIDYLEDKLIDKLTQLDHEIDRVEIINYPSIDAKTLTWIGGTIIPKLDSSKDMWIHRERWSMEIEKIDESKEKEKYEIKDKDNTSVINDNESKKDADTVTGIKDKNEKEKSRKKDKLIDVGVSNIRDKCPFQW